MSNELQLGRNVEYLVDTLAVCTRKDLATAMEVTPQSIGQLISGNTKGLKPLNLVAAAIHLQVTERDLVLMDMARCNYDPRRAASEDEYERNLALFASEQKGEITLTKDQQKLKDMVNMLARSLTDEQARAITAMVKASISQAAVAASLKQLAKQ